MASRSEPLEFTLLGLLSAGPLHGYELRKRCLAILGPFRALSFGSLYPQLRRMALSNLIEVTENETAAGSSRRAKISYSITEAGKKRFAELTENSDASEDEAFGVHFAFFGPTSRTSRVRILEARRRRLKDKAEVLSKELERSPLNGEVLGIDKYLIEWRRHSLDSASREIAWLDEMIQSERKTQ